MSVTYSECVSVALRIQHEKRMRRIISISVACLLYFSTLFSKRHDFREKVLGHQICVLIFSTTVYETSLIVTKIQRDIIINVLSSLCKEHVVVVKMCIC
jgi:hypothetical protein